MYTNSHCVCNEHNYTVAVYAVGRIIFLDSIILLIQKGVQVILDRKLIIRTMSSVTCLKRLNLPHSPPIS